MNPARAFGPAALSGYLKDHVRIHAVSITLTTIGPTVCGADPGMGGPGAPPPIDQMCGAGHGCECEKQSASIGHRNELSLKSLTFAPFLNANGQKSFFAPDPTRALPLDCPQIPGRLVLRADHGSPPPLGKSWIRPLPCVQ